MEKLVTHLENVFKERCETNEQYSLRAFAKNINIPPSTLSEILNRKRPLSKKLGLKIGKALKMSSDQVNAFIGDVEHSKDFYQQIALDSFYLISQWWHYGVLQLIKTTDFNADSVWIANRLGITTKQVKEALERLERVGILEFDENGNCIDVTNGVTSHLVDSFTNEQLKDFQVRANNKAIDSIKRDPIEFRDNTSMTMAINKKSLVLAKEEIKKFRRKLTKKLEKYAEPDEVYQLTIGLNPLTLLKQENNNENC